MHIIVAGNLSDGFRFFGPFPTAGKAAVFADANTRNGDWWIASVEAPDPTAEYSVDAEREMAEGQRR